MPVMSLGIRGAVLPWQTVPMRTSQADGLLPQLGDSGDDVPDGELQDVVKLAPRTLARRWSGSTCSGTFAEDREDLVAALLNECSTLRKELSQERDKRLDLLEEMDFMQVEYRNLVSSKEDLSKRYMALLQECEKQKQSLVEAAGARVLVEKKLLEKVEAMAAATKECSEPDWVNKEMLHPGLRLGSTASNFAFSEACKSILNIVKSLSTEVISKGRHLVSVEQRAAFLEEEALAEKGRTGQRVAMLEKHCGQLQASLSVLERTATQWRVLCDAKDRRLDEMIEERRKLEMWLTHLRSKSAERPVPAA